MNHDVAYSVSKVSVTDKILAPSHTDDARIFEGFVLYYVFSGDGVFFSEGREYPLEQGAAALVPPSLCHSLRCADASLLSYRQISFSAESLLRIIDPPTALSSCALFSPSRISESVISALTRIQETDRVPTGMLDAYRSAILTEMLILLLSSGGKQTEREDKSLGARIIGYVDENLTENLSLDTLSRVFFVSKYHLCRAFKAYHGISVHSYIIKKRVLLAKRLIEEGEAPSSVAYKVGFGDYSAFYRAYRKVTGTYPASELTHGK
ncbi:MAG: helix-turn-helix domain-containing protein [Clostridia bacterium]|nr:helix-turn-helix domain-containing protein [Clostridia bacterium]